MKEMGLDQYAYCSKDELTDDNLGQMVDGDRASMIMQWRKHNRLQGWMDSLWEQKGNSDEFNCKLMELTEDEILQLREDVRTKNLPETTGFFFGEDSYIAFFEEYVRQDIEFVKTALEKIRSGHRIYYSCWW